MKHHVFKSSIATCSYRWLFGSLFVVLLGLLLVACPAAGGGGGGASASNDATLGALSLSGGTLSPDFASGTLRYTATVPNAATSINVTATTNHNLATLTVDGDAVNSGVASGAITLSVGANSIPIVVTAEDSTTTQTYTVVVTRAASGTMTDATLSNLTISSGMLDPVFASATTNYDATVDNSVASLTVTPTVSQSAATVTVNGTAVTSGSASSAIALTVGDNTINIVVTAPDSSTMQSYSITVTRAALGASNDADLSALTISSGTLSPVFASGTTSYTVTVGYSVANLTVTPTVNQDAATVTVNGTAVNSGVASNAITLNEGTNTINIEVTAEDVATTQTYSITVTRAAASNDAALSALTISSGILDPVFASATTSYDVTVDNSVANLTVTPTVNQAAATVTVNGTAVNSGVASSAIALSVGGNTINIVVTAEDATTTQTYSITVTRLALFSASTGTWAQTSGDAMTNIIIASSGVVDFSTTIPLANTSGRNFMISTAAGTRETATTVTINLGMERYMVMSSARMRPRFVSLDYVISGTSMTISNCLVFATVDTSVAVGSTTLGTQINCTHIDGSYTKQP